MTIDQAANELLEMLSDEKRCYVSPALQEKIDALRQALASPDDVEKVALLWLAKEAGTDDVWARKIIDDCRDAEHLGDCNGVPATCNRCVVDEAFDFARSVLAALTARKAT